MSNVSSEIREAVNNTAEAIKPLLAKVRNEEGGFPAGFWQDEFALGFLSFLIEQQSKLEVRSSDQESVLSDIYDALGVDGVEIARKQIQLQFADPKHADFEQGYENASVCMLASAGQMEARGSPSLEAAKKLAALRGTTDDRDAIAGILFEDLFYGPLGQRLSQANVSGSAAAADEDSKTARKDAVVLTLPNFDKSKKQARQAPPGPGGTHEVPDASKADATPLAFLDLSEFDEATRQIEEMEARLQELRKKGDNWQKAVQSAAAAQQNLLVLQADIEKLRGDRDEWISKAEAAQAAFESASKQLVALERELEKLRGDRDEWISKADAAQAASDTASERLVALEADLEELRSERQSWESKMEAARVAADDFRQHLVARSTELDRVGNERDRLQTEAAVAQAAANDLRQRYAALEADLDQLRSERASWQSEAEAGQRALVTVSWAAVLTFVAVIGILFLIPYVQPLLPI